MNRKNLTRLLFGLLFIGLIAHYAGWHYARNMEARWPNVPPAPSYDQAMISALGDEQLAYRTIAIMLQNIGSSGGDVQNLANYNYKELAKWFFLSLEMDDKSDAIPYLATYFFGSVEDGQKVREIMPYIYHVGMLPYRNNWRYLAHGVFLARHGVKDFDMAMKFADKLATIDEDLPIWTKQMRVFIQYDQGEKEAAYDLMKQIMMSGLDTLPPEEIFAMKVYICTKILDEQQASADPICQK